MRREVIFPTFSEVFSTSMTMSVCVNIHISIVVKVQLHIPLSSCAF